MPAVPQVYTTSGVFVEFGDFCTWYAKKTTTHGLEREVTIAVCVARLVSPTLSCRESWITEFNLFLLLLPNDGQPIAALMPTTTVFVGEEVQHS